jgi:hypothetical protein
VPVLNIEHFSVAPGLRQPFVRTFVGAIRAFVGAIRAFVGALCCSIFILVGDSISFVGVLFRFQFAGFILLNRLRYIKNRQAF